MKLPHPVDQPDEFRAWSLLYLERQLSPAEERAFADLLRTSEEARREFAEAAQFDAHLYEIRNQETLVESKPPSRRRAVSERPTAWIPGLVAAGIVVSIALSIALSRPEPKAPLREGGTQAKVVTPEIPVVPPPPAPPKPPPEEPKVAPIPPTPVPEPRVEPLPEPPPPVRPEEKKQEPAPAPEKKTVVVARLGRLEQAQGQVWLLAGKSRVEAKSGMDLVSGQGVQTFRESAASIVFADGTRLDLSAETLVRDLSDLPQKQAQIAQGTISADVVKQPAGAPMRLSTPAADLTIIGTRFVVTVEPKATRLQVKEGQVRFARKKDGATLDVPGGSTATVSDGIEFTARAVRVIPVLKGRTNVDLEALYLFSEGKGAVVEDVSGVGEPLDLRIRDEAAVRWLPAGILVRAPTVLVTNGAATKIIESCRRSHEVTVEAWIQPASAAEAGPARILSLASGPSTRGFMLGQGEDKGANPLRFTLRLRTGSTNENGMPGMMSDEGTVKAGLTHVVATRTRPGAAHFYVDGQERGRLTVGGDFGKWGKDLRLSLADEPVTEPGQSWLGAYYLVAIYSRALTPDEVLQHFKAGPAPARAR